MNSQFNNDIRTEDDGLPIVQRRVPCQRIRQRLRQGFTLVELMVVLTIMAVMLSFAVPNVHRTVEHLRADIAGANLRSIWSAERLYWLDNRTFTNDLSELEALGLLDPSISGSTEWYTYSVTFADATSFKVIAVRTGSNSWQGDFVLDDTGVVGGSISAEGQSDILPGMQ